MNYKTGTMRRIDAVLVASIALVITSVTAECDPKSCPHRYYLAHYTELGCEPIYDKPDTCCPARFDCSSRQDLAVDRCYFQGKEFKIGDILFNTIKSPACAVHCRCVEDYKNKTLAVVTCGHVDCPEYFSAPPLPTCRLLYKEVTDCCSSYMICNNVTEESERICKYDGKVYYHGQIFTPKEDKCMSCLCNEGFNGTLIEPYCKKTQCHVDLHYMSKIRRNCVPVYYKNVCCPIKWICPDDIDVSKLAVNSNTTSENREIYADSSDNKVCHFGSLTFDQGEALPVEIAGKCIKCECSVPPVPTCVKNNDNC